MKKFLFLLILTVMILACMPAMAEQTPRLMGGPNLENAALMEDGQLIQSALSADDRSTQNQWFAYESADPDAFCSFTVENMGSTGDAQGFGFVLKDKDGAKIANSDVVSGKTVSLSAKIPVGERVYAHIYGFHEVINGIFRVSFDVVPDPEGEAGIAPVSGQVYTLNVREDQDVFVYETGEYPSYMNLTATNITLWNDLHCRVVDVDGVESFNMRVYGQSGTNTKLFYMAPNNRYTITVYAADACNYKLDYTVAEDIHPDTMETAQAIAPDESVAGGIQGYEDQDWFLLTCEDAAVYQRLSLTNASCTEMELVVCDQYQQKIASCSLRAGNSVPLDFKVPQPGSYYVKVTGYGKYIGDYALSRELVVDPEGDAAEIAAVIETGAVCAARLETANDMDWFAIDGVDHDRTVGVSLDTRPEAIRGTVFAYDAYGRTLAEHWVDNRQICFTVEQPANERIYLSFTGDVSGAYVIETCADDKHIADTWQDTAASSCMDAGERLVSCRICGQVVGTEIVPASGHVPGEWEIVFNASCSEPGERVSHCTLCGAETAREAMAPVGHHETYWQVETEVTCTTDGVQSQYCPYCGMIVGRERIPCVGHIEMAGEVLSQPSCGAPGVTVYYCSLCGELAREEMTPGGEHVPGERLNVNGVASAICDECGTIFPYEG